MPIQPNHRLRRLRGTHALRSLVAETTVTANDLVYPLFVMEGRAIRREVPSMPGVFRLSPDQLPAEIDDLLAAGVRAVLLFGIPESATKDTIGTPGWTDNGIVPTAIATIKSRAPELLIIADVCLCEYTSHGHCGLLRDAPDTPADIRSASAISLPLNDPTLPYLARAAVAYARAGANVIAPSDLMDGRVGFLRSALDEAGFLETPILSYSTKFASAMYGPFRDAAQSAPSSGDRKAHQLNPANAREALRQAAADLEQGADMLMVKPALAYLDILATLRARHDCPLAAYHVSGEYAMIKAAAARGWIDEPRAVWETLTSIKRAGADFIITYYAKDFLAGSLSYQY